VLPGQSTVSDQRAAFAAREQRERVLLKNLRRSTMTGKALWLLPATLAVLAATQWRDIARYLKLERMSIGDGHPELVPIHGRHAYPAADSDGAADGTGDFDSARRGGGPLAA
jgi:hypothetical protein